MPKIVGDEQELQRYIGHRFEPSRWITVDQSRIDAFAHCTEDHQYIHVDPERAARTPLGGTVAHGFLLLSLLAPLCEDCGLELRGATMALNYGFDRVRFLSPVRAGSRIRAHVEITGVEAREPGQLLLRQAIRVEIEGEEKPALIADWLGLWLR